MIRRLLLLTLGIVAWHAAAFAQTCPPGVSWCSGAYAYDGMGNIRAIGADTYVYDTAGRLVSGTADVQRTPAVVSRQDYSYDAFGNRTGASRTAGSVNCPGGCELSPAIDPVTNHITGSGAQYDAAGNLTFIQGPPNASYTYDAAGSLVHAVAGTDDRQFLYTADDERIATASGVNGATWTWTVRGLDGKVLREFTSFQPQGGLPTGQWQWTKDYVWRDGLLLASVTPAASGGTVTQHFHLDHLGTPRLVTGDNGVQLSVHAYYPFGAELNLTPTEQPAELMKFTGHERDLLANDPHTLDYMHARYEMGTMGRFLSVDPVLETKKALHAPQMWNRYSYVLNNPMVLTDPTGTTIYVVTYTTGNREGGDDELRRAAFTRAAQIMGQKGFDSKKDRVLLSGVKTGSDWSGVLASAKTLESKYGKVGSVSLFSHSGLDGPVFHTPAGDPAQFSFSQLSKIAVNWGSGATASFFGCNTATGGFTQAWANAQGVTTYGFDNTTYFSSNPGVFQSIGETGPVYMINAPAGSSNMFLLGNVLKHLGMANARDMVESDPK
jgi:RHS repeat-associated protein